MSDWITHCDRCRRPVRVSLSREERAQTELYCESCFNSALETPEPPEPPPRAQGEAPAPLPAAHREAGARQEGVTYVVCENCRGTGRVPLVLGVG
jgi:hypothetical protein